MHIYIRNRSETIIALQSKICSGDNPVFAKLDCFKFVTNESTVADFNTTFLHLHSTKINRQINIKIWNLFFFLFYWHNLFNKYNLQTQFYIKQVFKLYIINIFTIFNISNSWFHNSWIISTCSAFFTPPYHFWQLLNTYLIVLAVARNREVVYPGQQTQKMTLSALPITITMLSKNVWTQLLPISSHHKLNKPWTTTNWMLSEISNFKRLLLLTLPKLSNLSRHLQMLVLMV